MSASSHLSAKGHPMAPDRVSLVSPPQIRVPAMQQAGQDSESDISFTEEQQTAPTLQDQAVELRAFAVVRRRVASRSRKKSR